MGQIRSRFDSAPLQIELDITEPRWRGWFQAMWANAMGMGLPLPSAVAPGASPYVYQYQLGGQASLIVSGGTVSLVEFSRDGSTWYTVGTGPGSYQLTAGDRLRITYAAAPTINLVLR